MIEFNDDLLYFAKFEEEMYAEYKRHYLEYKDGWKRCNEFDLLMLMRKSIDFSLKEIVENPSHFIDIANFALFCYYRFKDVGDE